MKEVALVAAATAAMLGLIAMSIFMFDDRELLVSPPEAVAEDFVRALATGRYDIAMRYIDPESGMTPDDIRRQSDTMRAAGSIYNINVPEVAHDGQQAIARYAVQKAGAPEIQGTLQLRFSTAWRIVR